MESSRALRAAALSCSRSAAPTAFALGSVDFASTVSGMRSGFPALEFFPPQPERTANPMSKALPVDR
jgi:hypothetical protein